MFHFPPSCKMILPASSLTLQAELLHFELYQEAEWGPFPWWWSSIPYHSSFPLRKPYHPTPYSKMRFRHISMLCVTRPVAWTRAWCVQDLLIRFIRAGAIPRLLWLPPLVSVDELCQVGRLFGVPYNEFMPQQLFGCWPLQKNTKQFCEIIKINIHVGSDSVTCVTEGATAYLNGILVVFCC